MVELGDLAGGSFDSFASGLSADGSTVVGRGSTALGEEAFIWDAANGMRNLKDVLTAQGLNLTGWTLSGAREVSADGLTIVGYGNNPDGKTEAWIATIPEPSSFVLVSILGFLSLIPRRRGRTMES